MKKICIALAMICILSLVGCNSDKTDTESITMAQIATTEEIGEEVTIETVISDEYIEYRDPDIAQIYKEVLQNNRSFVSVVEGGREIYLKDYNYYKGAYVDSLFISGFSFIDIDSDDNYEVVVDLTLPLSDSSEQEKLILYYEDEKVYGYYLPQWLAVTGDNMLDWISIDYPGVGISTYYIIPIEVRVENKELKYTYIFKEEGDEDEQWLRDKGVLTENDAVRYVGEEYEKYEYPKRTREYGYELRPENIDKYLK